jgi:MFS family permease
MNDKTDKTNAVTLTTGYEYTVVALNFFIVGFVALDRLLIANLFPWVMPSLKIDYTQAGLIMAVLSLTWSVSAIVFGGVSDRIGRKIIIIPATIVFSLLSWISGMVNALGQLLGIRAFMGVAEGAYYPTAIATVAEESKPERRAANIGIFLSAFNIVGMILCPIYSTFAATHWGWRMALYLTVIPGILLALLFWRLVREPASTALKKQARKEARTTGETGPGGTKGWLHIFTYRNVIVGAFGAIFCMGWSFTILTFAMTFNTQARHLAPQIAGFTMAMLGLGGAIGSFVIPYLSDQLGRKAGIIFAGFCTAIATFALAFWSASVGGMMLCFFLMGFFGYGIFPILTGALPYESVPFHLTASAVGFIVFIGEIIGAAAAPAIGGMLADKYGLHITMASAAVSVFVATICAFALKETAPKVLSRRKG